MWSLYPCVKVLQLNFCFGCYCLKKVHEQSRSARLEPMVWSERKLQVLQLYVDRERCAAQVPYRVPNGCAGNNYIITFIFLTTQSVLSIHTQRDHSLQFLQDQSSAKPFLAVIAPPSAHAPFVPADRHRNLFADLDLIKGPNFNIPSGELGIASVVYRSFYYLCVGKLIHF